MASSWNIPTLFLCILTISLIYLINLSETKPNKKRHHNQQHLIAKCTSEFLWEALSAAGKGNDSATYFLSHELHTLGFTKDGIRSRSIAANWQSKLSATPSESVFSNLQKLGAVDLTKRCAFCERSDNVEISLLVPKNKERMSNSRVNMNNLVKSITKLYANPTEDEKELKTRTKKLRRLLKEYWSNESPCAKTSPMKTSPKPPPKKKNKEDGVDSIEICLRMIKELMDRGLCEDANESFQWTYLQLSQSYTDKSLHVPTAVTVQVP